MLFLPPIESLPLKVCKEGVILYVKASPKTSKNSLGQIIPGEYHPVLKIYIKAIAADGKANDALIQLLKDKFHLEKKDIVLKSGATQKLKTFLIKGKSLEEIAALIV